MTGVSREATGQAALAVAHGGTPVAQRDSVPRGAPISLQSDPNFDDQLGCGKASRADETAHGRAPDSDPPTDTEPNARAATWSKLLNVALLVGALVVSVLFVARLLGTFGLILDPFR